ncbi:glycosyltransferase [Campylobacter hominis]|uniref:Putative AcbV n=1 Tax=Campylobacter hominis (strain ATCC BAA-381 / DSM 21671 / CCUG 45161 / LMG 19568 / NCTC 13146 / CH001A) TaxID=360107 RepID=A7I3C0_CAMHC|nr:glycosyltransferase [Campylobacter hominis]ABS52221.1 putative AcbV [Campylobacter hominis ATCC BAA-381]UAK85770.1 glycosyltransferase [Campylobacter hominis]SUW85517.1 putative AcbV [Campylobacter hominis]
MKIKVITGRYPSLNNPYNHMFVHTRNMEYLNYGHSVEVFVPSKNKYTYNIDGIKVNYMTSKEIIKSLDDKCCVIIHLLIHSLIDEIDGGVIYQHIIKNDIKTLFFIHGIEVQKILKSRTDDIKFSQPKSIIRFLYRDFYLIHKMKNTIQDILKNTKNIKFVSVSKWMQKEAENTLGVKFENKIFIIPNGIDTNLFYYQENLYNNKYKILTIRPLILKGKYAVDLSIDTMKYITNYNVSLNIYGKGNEYNNIVKYIRDLNLSNKINLHNSFIEHKDIPKIHKQHGIYYAVTKMDAQGVSMCEAMSSGLPTISFDVCAISEFITNNINGLLISPYDLKDAANKLDELISNKNLFLRLSENARKSIEKIDIKITTKKELELLNV